MEGERRKYRRKLFCVPVVIKEREGEGYYVDYSSDISEGGMLIHTQDLKRPGEKLTVSFRFPESIHWIEVECEVVWTSKQEGMVPAMGLKFVNLTEEDREYIRRYMEREGRALIEEKEIP